VVAPHPDARNSSGGRFSYIKSIERTDLRRWAIYERARSGSDFRIVSEQPEDVSLCWSQLPHSASRLCECARRRNSFTSLPNDGRAAALPFRLLSSLVLYFAKASSFLTDFTPGTPRAISEALALAPMVAT
jgi:hypothetical protein